MKTRRCAAATAKVGGGGSDGRVVPDADISLLLWELLDMMSASERDGGHGKLDVVMGVV